MLLRKTVGGCVGENRFCGDRFLTDSTLGMTYHTPVLLVEIVAQLQPRRGALYVDATVGGGGHAAEILRASAPDGQLIGLDRDEEALAASRERLSEWGARVQLVHANFGELEQVLMSVGVTAVDAIVFDLGVSSRQFDEPSRGFSFQREGVLDMRMDRTTGSSARDFINTASETELADVFFRYGEERRSRFIARRIVAARPIETTTQLADLIGPRRGKIHPATRVFQALRIYVNDELENLRRGLAAGTRVLSAGGRLAVISFHSLEDRIVKHYFRETSALRVVTRKPVIASNEEREENPRARSAKLRVAEKI
jgi:16S rRNA (cytosine1402-N4)-methyltransferase